MCIRSPGLSSQWCKLSSKLSLICSMKKIIKEIKPYLNRWSKCIWLKKVTGRPCVMMTSPQGHELWNPGSTWLLLHWNWHSPLCPKWIKSCGRKDSLEPWLEWAEWELQRGKSGKNLSREELKNNEHFMCYVFFQESLEGQQRTRKSLMDFRMLCP
jgi:hypothetical protein